MVVKHHLMSPRYATKELSFKYTKGRKEGRTDGRKKEDGRAGGREERKGREREGRGKEGRKQASITF